MSDKKQSDTVTTSHQQLRELAETTMPFGKYAGRLLIDLPEPYIVWFAGRGFPSGKLGQMMQTIYEIKVNGLEYLFEPLRTAPRPQTTSGHPRGECTDGTENQ